MFDGAIRCTEEDSSALSDDSTKTIWNTGENPKSARYKNYWRAQDWGGFGANLQKSDKRMDGRHYGARPISGDTVLMGSVYMNYEHFKLANNLAILREVQAGWARNKATGDYTEGVEFGLRLALNIMEGGA